MALAKNTVRAYDDALCRVMVIEDRPAWAPHPRSRSRIRSSAERHFVDPSLAVAALRATPERLLEDLNLLGFLFESLVIRDLRVHARASDAQVLRYQDNTGLEVDAVVETADGRWAAFEIELDAAAVEEGAGNLRRCAQRVDAKKSGRPQLWGGVTGTGLAYRRPDGIGSPSQSCQPPSTSRPRGPHALWKRHQPSGLSSEYRRSRSTPTRSSCTPST